MSKQIGRKTSVGFAKESVRGTPVSPTFFIPHLELTVDDKITQAIDESAVNVIEDAIDAKVVEKMTEGTMRAIATPDSLGLILLATLGQVATVTDSPETGANTHTFSVLQTAQHPSLTITEKGENVDRAFPLAMIETFELTLALQAHVSYSISFRSKIGESASSTVVIVDEDKFIPQQVTFKIATDLAGLGAEPETRIKALSMTITKNLEDDRNFGSVDPDDILNKQFMIEGTVELLHQDDAFHDFVTGDTARAMRIDLLHSENIGATSTKAQLTFDIAKVKFSEIARDQSLNELVRQTLTFKGFYSLSDAKSIEAVLINGVTSY